MLILGKETKEDINNRAFVKITNKQARGRINSKNLSLLLVALCMKLETMSLD